MGEVPFYVSVPPNLGDDKMEIYSNLLLQSRWDKVAVDIETISLDDKTPIGLGISVSPDHSFYFPIENEINPYIPWHILNNPAITKLYHNGIFDLDPLNMIADSMSIPDIETTNIADTSIMARMMREPVATLTMLAYGVGKETTPASEILKHFGVKTFDKVPELEVALHCIQDTQVTYALHDKWEKLVDKEYFSIENQIINILFRMSKWGFKLDQVLCRELEQKLSKEVSYYWDICEAEGFKPSSPQQVGYILAKRENFLPYKRRKYGQKLALDTSKEVLQYVEDPMATIVLQYRKLADLLSVVQPLVGEDRCYTQFHLDAITSRVSSKGIKGLPSMNMQNITTFETSKFSARHIVLPDADKWTDIDYSQIELRVLAHLSQDSDMLQVYEEDKDIHTETAVFLGIPRKIAKNVGFGMLYGATPQTLKETARIQSLSECQRLINIWFKKYKGAERWIRDCQLFGLTHGYITTLYGRDIVLPMEMDNDDGIKRKAVNYTIQASAAEITKRAMIRCWNEKMPMRLQVHDELLFNGDVSDQILKLELDHIVDNFSTPISLKVLERWE